MQDLSKEQLSTALENIEEINFDCFSFVSALEHHSLPFLIYKIF